MHFAKGADMKSFSWLASYLTILGVSINSLVHFWGSANFWMKNFLLLGCIAAGLLAIIDFNNWRKNKPKRFKSPEDVNHYMLKLFKRGGSISVYANSFAWLAHSEFLRQFLVREARHGRQICLFCPRHNELTRV